MAKILNYTDERGVTYDESYWRLTFIQIDIQEKAGQFRFVGYRDEQAFQDKLEPIGRAVAVVTDERFDYYLSLHLVNGLNLQQIAYQLAEEKGLFLGGIDAA